MGKKAGWEKLALIFIIIHPGIHTTASAPPPPTSLGALRATPPPRLARTLRSESAVAVPARRGLSPASCAPERGNQKTSPRPAQAQDESLFEQRCGRKQTALPDLGSLRLPACRRAGLASLLLPRRKQQPPGAFAGVFPAGAFPAGAHVCVPRPPARAAASARGTPPSPPAPLKGRI